jgi:hypothetical protein
MIELDLYIYAFSMELRSFEKSYVALLNSSNWATGGPIVKHSLRVGWRNHGILMNYRSNLLVLFFCFVFYVKFNTTSYVRTYGGTTSIYRRTDGQTDGRINLGGAG